MKTILLSLVLVANAHAGLKEVRCLQTNGSQELRLYIEQNSVEGNKLNSILLLSQPGGMPQPRQRVKLQQTQPVADRTFYDVLSTGDELELANSVLGLYGPGLAKLDRDNFDCSQF